MEKVVARNCYYCGHVNYFAKETLLVNPLCKLCGKNVFPLEQPKPREKDHKAYPISCYHCGIVNWLLKETILVNPLCNSCKKPLFGPPPTEQSKPEEVKESKSMDRTDLQTAFKTPGKTLKLQKLENFPLNDAITLASRFVRDNNEGIGRVEFRSSGLYYVVAKLKE